MERYLLINSTDRISGNSSNFKIHLSHALHKVSKIKLLSVSLPNTIYNITTANNRLDFTDGITYTITIPPGAYTVNSLIGSHQTLLNATPSALNFTVSYSATTLKVTISANGSFQLLFGTGSNASFSCSKELGFESIDTINANSHTLQQKLLAWGYHTMFSLTYLNLGEFTEAQIVQIHTHF